MGLKDTLFMKCANASALVQKMHEGKLTFLEKVGLKIHLLYCSICKLFFHQSEIVDKSYNRFADGVNREEKVFPLHPQRKASMKQALHEEMNK